MLTTRNPSTVAPPAGMYSHSVEVPANTRWLVTAGQVGMRPDGTTPEGFEAQHDQIWQNTVAILNDAGFGVEDIVRINVFSTDPDGLQYVMAHRKKYLNPDHTPGSTWLVISQLANPQWVVEMETIAAKAD
ncbi:MAG: RidA family protein [Alphaproteobacteria bacterium]|nr:RidA family protein [Alphaproteobacteria bacterium]